MTTLNCYLVEDSPVIRDNLVAALEEMTEVRVIGTADDERTAIEWLATGEDERRCDLMIVDIFLKAGSGLGVLRAARNGQASPRMVVLSNYATDDMRRRCLDLGASRVFDKSSDIDELIAYCERLVEVDGDLTRRRQ